MVTDWPVKTFFLLFQEKEKDFLDLKKNRGQCTHWLKFLGRQLVSLDGKKRRIISFPHSYSLAKYLPNKLSK